MDPTEIRALARVLDRIDYYKLLRVEPGAPVPRIRSAYHEARRRFNPDAHLRDEPEIRDVVDRIAKRVTEAYVTLRDSSRRNAYDKGLDEGQLRYSSDTADAVKEESETQLGLTPNGRKFFALAEQAERAGDVGRTISNLKMALTFEPRNERFKAKLAELEAAQKSAPRGKSSPFKIGS
jgi:DnaJ-class molecular chaperone